MSTDSNAVDREELAIIKFQKNNLYLKLDRKSV